MQSNPDVYYATSSEIRKNSRCKTGITGTIYSIDISSYEFTQDVQDGLETLRKT